MITDGDIKKLKEVFATREAMERGFIEIIEFVGEVKNDIMKELNEFRGEVNAFRVEMRDINRNNQSTLNNHESRIAHLELK